MPNQKPKIYIDGREGTTGLQIYDRLSRREDIELLLIDEDKRKDTSERKKFLNEADLVFLCLPDAAAVEAVELIENDRTRVIDASTAHRTAPGWVYGFPELHGQAEKIKTAMRVANPGCHATGFISIVRPLAERGLLREDALLSCFSLTGYSGGGKKMIAQYENEARPQSLRCPALYGLLQNHKHLKEMQQVCSLEHPPIFNPIVDDYYKGMAVTVPLYMSQLRGVSTLHEVWKNLFDYYMPGALTGTVRVGMDPTNPDSGVDAGYKIYAGLWEGKDTLYLLLAGNDERFTITALFDNLGKGASGGAVQNMNLMLGFRQTEGLNVQ